MTTPRVYVCMLNWNGRKHLEYAVPSVLRTRYPDWKLVVVDNASTDDSVAWLKREHPEVELVVSPENGGWSAGNNHGLRRALAEGYDWVALVNNDILVPPFWLSEVLQAAERDPLAVVLGFDIHGRTEPVPRETYERSLATYETLQTREAEVLFGAALLVKADLFRQLGLLDEGYFMYFDEFDFEHRVRLAGYRLTETNLPIWHFIGGSSGQVNLKTCRWFARSHLRSYVKLKDLSFLDALAWTKNRTSIAVKSHRHGEVQGHYMHKYLPSKNRWVNASLVAQAFLWNLLRWTQTKAAGRRDLQAAQRQRAKLGSQAVAHVAPQW